MAQYDALSIQPHIQAEVLNSDENQPARVWRERRAQVARAVHLYPKGHSLRRQSEKASHLAWGLG